ncbi:uncharacterized protein [Chironomus tepperi]|uniref:uncharacterized protein n=1 Tax=Chironomus tepperi TaxID=113505 RepID=UPI00391FB70B
MSIKLQILSIFLIITTTIPKIFVESVKCNFKYDGGIYAESINSNPQVQSYICNITFTIYGGYENPSEIRGNHQSSRTDTDVKIIQAHDPVRLNAITSVFCDTFQNIEAMEIVNTETEVIDENAFQNCAALKTLFVRVNKIQKLPENLLTIYSKLTNLWLNFNQLTTLPEKLLNTQSELKGLYLGNNQLYFLPNLVFYYLVKLQYLDLGNNRLQVINPNWFTNLRILQELSIDSNQISDLPANVFKPLVSLQSLLLQNNIIKNVNPDSFVGLQSLKSLVLGNNQIMDLPGKIFAPLISLEMLWVDHNRLTTINSYSFHVHPQLTTINLASNKIIAIDPNLIDNTAVSYLNMLDNVCYQDEITGRDRMKQYLVRCIENYQAQQVQSNTCGIQQVVGRGNIIGGSYITRGAFPWIAALVRPDGSFFCGGTIISDQTVLTAAHCIFDKSYSRPLLPRDITVLVGVHNLNDNLETERVLKAVQTIVLHPDWNPKTESFDADIAVFVLGEKIIFTKYIQPICLIDPSSFITTINSGVVVGYGKSEDPTKVHENIPKILTFPLHKNDQCFLRNKYLSRISSPRTFCGGEGRGLGVCSGDSGSGLVVFYGNTYYLRGIVSSGLFTSRNQCDVNTYSVFTDVLPYTDWISSVTSSSAYNDSATRPSLMSIGLFRYPSNASLDDVKLELIDKYPACLRRFDNHLDFKNSFYESTEDERRRTKTNEDERRRTKTNEDERRRTKTNEDERRRTKTNEDERRRTKTNEDERRRTKTNEDERRRTKTNDDERRRTKTNEDERRRTKTNEDERRRTKTNEDERRRTKTNEDERRRTKTNDDERRRKMDIKSCFDTFTYNHGEKLYGYWIKGRQIAENQDLKIIGNHECGKGDLDVFHVRFENCSIVKIPQGLTKKFPNLKSLEINNSKLKKISKNDLEEYKNLKAFFCPENELEYLPGDLFEGFKDLEYISFRSNDLKVIEPNILDGLTSLKVVNFSQNPNYDKIYSIYPVYDSNASLQEVKDDLNEKFIARFKFLGYLKESEQKLQQQVQELENLVAKLSTQSLLINDFKSFINDETTKDFHIQIGDHNFPVHKFLIAARSPTLAELLKNNPGVGNLKLIDIPVDIFEVILKFLYTDELPGVDGMNYLHLLAAAGKLKIEELKKYAGNKVIDNIDDNNAVEILRLGVKYQNDEMRQKAFKKIKEMYPKINFKDEWAVDPEKVKKVIEKFIEKEEMMRKIEEEFEKSINLDFLVMHIIAECGYLVIKMNLILVLICALSSTTIEITAQSAKCIYSYNNHLTYSYKVINDTYYDCYLDTTHETHDVTVTQIVGQHLTGFGDADVKWLGKYHSNNKLKTFSSIFCQKFKNIETIELDDVKLESIDVNSLLNCQNLKKLSLNYNKIDEISNNLLIKNSNLTNLMIKFNKLTTLPENVFKSQENLELLYLDNNQISSIPSNIFDPLVKLEVLGLSSNMIQSLNPDWFRHLNHLKQLKLYENQITKISSKCFKFLKKLENLWIFDNKIMILSPDSFDGLQNLQLLNLRNNDIADLPADVFTSLTNLQELNLGGNKLTTIHSDSFSHVNHIKELNLQYNRINAIDKMFIDNSDLSIVDMTGNICSRMLAITWSEAILNLRDCFDNYKPRRLTQTNNDFIFPLFRSLNLTTSSNSCGKAITGVGNIVGGMHIPRGSFPWIAALVFSTGNYFCGGTLISNRKVLTAAHCIQDKQEKIPKSPGQFLILLGIHDLKTSIEIGRIPYAIQKVNIHPDWNPLTVSFDADIAVLVIERDITFNEYIQPICMPKSNINDIKTGLIVGYGKSEDEKKIHENIPKIINTPIHTNEHCFLNNLNLVKISSERTFCGGSGTGVGACRGDSGNGLYVTDGNAYYLRGIVSSSIIGGRYGCDVDTYAVFTDVTKYVDWIDGVSVDVF